MEGAATFNPGFLGSNFNWWVGQIADDSTWRDNIIPGKYDDPNSVKGWGRRYKVRIIGLHDMGEVNIPSQDLPWANIMYPVTAGGGQAAASQTPNLRQGNMVFGFFLDEKDQQVPVIMGVLGNNSQTPLSSTIGDNKVTDATPGIIARSGIARGAVPKTEKTREVLPDNKLRTSKAGQSSYLAQPSPGTAVDKFGLPTNIPYNDTIRGYISDAEAIADKRVLTREKREAFVAEKVKKSLERQKQSERSPLSSPQSGAAIENADGVHQLSAADVKRQDLYCNKIALMKPDKPVESAIKAIQTEIDNLVTRIDKYIQSFQSYIESVSIIENTEEALKNLISQGAKKISKYMKIIFDKLIGYVNKILDQGLSVLVSSTPSTFRHLVADMKEQTTQLISCLYGKISDQLTELILGGIMDALDIKGLTKSAKQSIKNREEFQTFPNVPVCYAEDLVVNAIAERKDDIQEANEILLENIGNFTSEIQKSIAGLTKDLSGVMDQIPDIQGSITAALDFDMLNINVFGCSANLNVSASDFYTLCEGSGGQTEAQLPSSKSVNDAVATKESKSNRSKVKPFAKPRKDQEKVNHRDPPRADVRPVR